MKTGKGKILFVEDDKFERIAFERFAGGKSFPYDYTMAESVKQAANTLKSEKFDAVVMDYQLGDGTAFDLFNKIKDVPVVIVTGAGDQEIAVRAMKKGASDYLIKDQEGNHLKILPTVLEKAIDRKRAKVALRESEERYRTLFDQAADSVVLIDVESGELIEFNDKVHDLAIQKRNSNKLSYPILKLLSPKRKFPGISRKLKKKDSIFLKQNIKRRTVKYAML